MNVEREFEQLYRSHAMEVARFVGERVRRSDAHMVDDLVQAVFLRAWRDLPGLRVHGPGVVEAWLKTAARRVVCDHYRRRDGRGRLARIEVPTDPLASPIWHGHRAAVDDPAEQVCARVDLAASIAAADVEHRHAVQLRVVDELPWAETARRMRRGKAAVRRMVADVLAAVEAPDQAGRAS